MRNNLKAIVYDRDGTLNVTTSIRRPGQTSDRTDGYVLSIDELVLTDRAKAAITLTRRAGLIPFVFTQQNCIGKGLVTLAEVDEIHSHMNDLLGKDAYIEKYYLAWDMPGNPSPRSKPSSAMLLEILADYNLKPDEVVVIGDSVRDYKSAKAASMKFIRVISAGNPENWEGYDDKDCVIYTDVLEAVTSILS